MAWPVPRRRAPSPHAWALHARRRRVGQVVAHDQPAGPGHPRGLGQHVEQAARDHLGIQIANGAQSGALSASDWLMFNAKEETLTFGPGPLAGVVLGVKDVIDVAGSRVGTVSGNFFDVLGYDDVEDNAMQSQGDAGDTGKRSPRCSTVIRVAVSLTATTRATARLASQ